MRVDRFDLKPMQAIVNQFAALQLEGTDVSTDLGVDFRHAELTLLN